MAFPPPTVTISPHAAQAFRDAAEQAAAGDVLRLGIDAKFHNDLYFGRVEPRDVVVVTSGLTIAMDPRTARRADGLTIDWVEGPSGAGFKLENPNESSPLRRLRPADVLRMLRERSAFVLIDARPAVERARAAIGAARPLDDELESLPRDANLVFVGHHSSDGQRAARRFFERGFRNVAYVVGGIDAWSTLDPEIPRY